MQIPVEALSATAFAPFGHVIERPQRLPNATGPGWQWWGETALLAADDRPFGIGYLDLEPTDLRFDWAERHMRSPELLVPLGGDCLVYVGPPERPETPDRLPDMEHFRVFRVRQGQGVVLAPGVWHGAPLAIDRRVNVLVLLLQNSGSDDTSLQRFPTTPVEIDLRTSERHAT